MTIGRTRSARSTAFARDRTDTGGGTKTKVEQDSDVDMGSDADVDDEDDDDADEDAEPAPYVKDDGTPFTKADFDALQDVVKKERAKARAARKEAGTGPKPKDDASAGDTPDLARLTLDAETKAAAAWKPLVIRGQAAAALKEAGLIGDPARLLKLIDVDDIDVDPETGELDGLDEQVAELKKDYGQLFRRKGSRSIDAADRKPGSRTSKMSDSEIQAAQLRGEI